MARGRKPNPTKLNVIAGTYDHNPSRRPKDEPVAPSGWPEMPKHLNEIAKCKWWDTCRRLDALGILSEVYADALECYADAYSDYRTCQEMVAKLGPVLVSKKPDGTTEAKSNPYMIRKEHCQATLLKYEAEFGLTPSAKTRIAVDATAKDNEELKFFGA